MANTIIIYQGDGSTTDFVVPFDYLRKSFVRVFLDRSQELVGGATNDVNSDYYFVDPTTIRLRKIVPTVNQEITIRRFTSATDRVASFRDGSVLYAKDLDTSQVQAYHIAEEGRDVANEALNRDKFDNWDALNKRITNVGDPIDPKDATNKAYVDKIENDAGIHADSARASAGTAISAAKVASEKAFEVKEWHQKVKTLKDNVVENTALVTSQATIATQKASEASQSAQRAETAKTLADTAKENALASATTASEKANIATEKAMIATEKAQALEQAVNALKYAEGVSALKKQMENLQAQAEGKLFVYETDATEAYSKDVTEGAYPYAAVKSFGGKTIVWNQQIPNERISFSQTNAAAIQEGALAYWQFSVSTQPVKGHQYYIYFNAVGTTDNFKSARVFYGSTNSVQSGTGKVITAENSLNLFRCICTGNVGDAVGCSVSNLNIVDLTKMFGAGNEPTAEEFLQMFPEDYYEYNAGELKSAPINNLNIIGTNFIDISKRYNTSTCDFSDGVLSNKTVDTGTRTFVQIQGLTGSGTIDILYSTPVIEALKHYSCSFVLKHGQALRVKFNGATQDIVFLDSIILPNQYRSFVFSFDVISTNPSVVGGAKIKNIMLTKGASEKAYSPYKEENLLIPQAVRDLEGYGWSAGTAKNWIDWENKKYHREVASIDLGSLEEWYPVPATTENKVRFIAQINTIKPPSNPAVLPNILCSQYRSTTWEKIVKLDNLDKIIGSTLSEGTPFIGVVDSAYSDEGAFKESVKGVILYYALAKPEIIDISDIFPYDNLIEVEDGGTITFENTNGGNFEIPVPSEIVYQKKVTTNE